MLFIAVELNPLSYRFALPYNKIIYTQTKSHLYITKLQLICQIKVVSDHDVSICHNYTFVLI